MVTVEESGSGILDNYVVSDTFPLVPEEPVVMYRRGKRPPGRLRSMDVPAMLVAASKTARGDHVGVTPDQRRGLAPEDVFELRVRALKWETDQRLAAKFGVSQSTVTRAIDGDTYCEVPFPIAAITRPGSDWPLLYFPYQTTVEILADMPWDAIIPIRVQPPVPRWGMARLLRMWDEYSASLLIPPF